MFHILCKIILVLNRNRRIHFCDMLLIFYLTLKSLRGNDDFLSDGLSVETLRGCCDGAESSPLFARLVARSGGATSCLVAEHLEGLVHVKTVILNVDGRVSLKEKNENFKNQ